MNKKKQEILLLATTLCIFILVSLNSLVFFTRIDLTENKAFTISKVSKNLFEMIPEKVTITYYLSERLKKISPLPGQIEDLLYEYAAYGRGKIDVVVLDPAKENLQREMDKIGIVSQQIGTVEGTEQTVSVVYTGIALSYLDKQDVMPVVYDLSTLEYDLTSRIRKIITGQRKEVGILSGKPGAYLSTDFALLGNRLSADGFEVREIPKGEDIPQEVSILFVFGSSFTESEMAFVEKYSKRGGKLFIAVDGVDVDLQNNLAARAIPELPVDAFLKSYGITVGKELVYDALNRRLPVQRNTGSMVVQSMEKYPPWVSAQGSGLSRENPITARLSSLDFFWASPVRTDPLSGLVYEVLASSSGDSWIMRSRLVTNPYEAGAFKALSDEAAGRYPLVVSVRGSLEGAGETRLIVAGDSDGAGNLIRYADSRDNMTFFSNAAEWLSNDEDLLAIKTRAARDTRLTRNEDPKTRNSIVLFSQIINIFAVPFLVLVFGLARSARRRERNPVGGEGSA